MAYFLILNKIVLYNLEQFCYSKSITRRGGKRMMIQIEPQSDIPIYTQLFNQIVEGIAKGDINPGDSLPSVRSLAADLGVNMHTVNKSYHELEKKGIIQIVPKSGAVIQSPKTIDVGEALYEQLTVQWRPKIAESLVLGLEQEQIHTLIESIVKDLKGSKNKGKKG